MTTVYVPATSANIGAGFDTIGLALGLGNTVSMRAEDGCHIASLDGKQVPEGPENLVYQAAKLLYEECGRPFTGLDIRQKSPIPSTKGLGSSSACIVAGLVGANALLGNPCTRQDLLHIAVNLEGHPDNVAPALLGGCVASCMDGGKVYSVKKEISPTLCFAAVVPDFELSTEKARAALPGQVPLQDAVYNMSRAVLCQAALCEGRLDILPIVTDDRLHQPSRFALIPGARGIFDLALRCGAAAVYISGAGPTILAIVEKRTAGFWAEAKRALETAAQTGGPEGHFTLLQLEADNMGARLI